MAVNIISSPNALSHSSQPIRWGLQLTDLGSFPINKEIAVQLVIDGEISSDVKTVRPSSVNETIEFDFTDKVSRRLRYLNRFIDSSFSTTPLSEFSAVVSLNYGEASYNTENCASNSITLDQSTNDVRVFMSNVQYDFNDPISPNGYIFTRRPNCYKLPRGTNDTIVIFGNSTITRTVYDIDDVVIDTSTINGTDVHSLSIGMNNSINPLPNAAYYVVNIQVGTINQTYTINISNKKHRVLYFQEPLGSYTPMIFDDNESFFVNRTSSLINVLPRTNIDFITHLEDGQTNYNNVNYEEVSLSKRAIVHDGNFDYYWSFANASKFFIQRGRTSRTGISGQDRFMKLIIPSERIPVQVKRGITPINISGFISTQLSTHNY